MAGAIGIDDQVDAVVADRLRLRVDRADARRGAGGNLVDEHARYPEDHDHADHLDSHRRHEMRPSVAAVGLRTTQRRDEPVAVVRGDGGDESDDRVLDEHELAVRRRGEGAERADLLVREHPAGDTDGEDGDARQAGETSDHATGMDGVRLLVPLPPKKQEQQDDAAEPHRRGQHVHDIRAVDERARLGQRRVA